MWKLFDPRAIGPRPKVRRNPVCSRWPSKSFLDRLFSLLTGIRNATIIVALIQALARAALISNMWGNRGVHQKAGTAISDWSAPRAGVPNCRLPAVIAASWALGWPYGGLGGREFLFSTVARPGDQSGILPAIDGATLVWGSPIRLALGAGLARGLVDVTLRSTSRCRRQGVRHSPSTHRKKPRLQPLNLEQAWLPRATPSSDHPAAAIALWVGRTCPNSKAHYYASGHLRGRSSHRYAR